MRYDAILRRYRSAWRRLGVVLLTVPFVWTLVASLGSSLLPKATGQHLEFENLIAVMDCLAIAAPALAWVLARRGLRRQRAQAVAPLAPYRTAPLDPPSWRISGPFPWLAPATLGVLVVYTLVLVCLVSLWRILGSRDACGDVSWLLMWLPALVVLGCLVWLWVRCWRRDAGRVGVLERVRQEDGSHALVLHTLQGVEHVTIAWAKPSSRRLRLEGSRQIWHAVEPIDDLVAPDLEGVT